MTDQWGQSSSLNGVYLSFSMCYSIGYKIIECMRGGQRNVMKLRDFSVILYHILNGLTRIKTFAKCDAGLRI